MIGYLDSSVLMRIVLNQKGRLHEFSKLKRPISSKVLKTECLRTLDRARLARLLTEKEHYTAVGELYDSMDCIEWIQVSDKVLDKAGSNFAVSLGTLDAIHLCSAILWREQTSTDCVFLTHDNTLKKAAILAGFTVLG
ncbi:MAG: hypothetical protein HY537_15680 [Deltaproteobacteria bacterium]|nr:hypothetical protein [Deltaproteobacteria bacterium]